MGPLYCIVLRKVVDGDHVVLIVFRGIINASIAQSNILKYIATTHQKHLLIQSLYFILTGQIRTWCVLWERCSSVMVGNGVCTIWRSHKPIHWSHHTTSRLRESPLFIKLENQLSLCTIGTLVVDMQFFKIDHTAFVGYLLWSILMGIELGL